MAGTTLSTQIIRKEDVMNIISLLDYKTLPFLDRLRRGHQPFNEINSWTVDEYDDPSTEGVPERQDVSEYDDEASNRRKLSVFIQKWRRTWSVSDFAEKMDVYGLPEGEVSNAIMRALEVAGRDIECTFLSDNVTTDAGGPRQNAFKTRGMGGWIWSPTGSESYSYDGLTDKFNIDSKYRTPEKQIGDTDYRKFTEKSLKGIFTSVFDNIGYSQKGMTLLCGSALRVHLTAMTLHGTTDTGGISGLNNQAANRRINLQGKTVTDTIDKYVGDFGEVDIVPSSWIGYDVGANNKVDKGRGYILDFDKLEVGFLGFKMPKELEDRGGGRRGFVDTYGVLRCIDPRPHGKIGAKGKTGRPA